MIRQSGAVPVLLKNNEPLILLIDNVHQTRLIVPKGIIEDGQTPEDAAARESMEEAGVSGEILSEPLGRYTYNKWNDTCRVDLFILSVRTVHERWDEDNFRKRYWNTWDEFLEKVDDRIPRSLLWRIPELAGFTNTR